MKTGENNSELSRLGRQMGLANCCLVLITLYVLVQMPIGVCLAGQWPDFAAFMKIHEAHRNAVRTGMVRMRYTEYEFVPQAAVHQWKLQHEAWREERIAEILEDPNLSLKAKELNISAIERAKEPNYFLASERMQDIYRDFIFDFSKWRFKSDEKPIDPNFFERWGLDLDRVVWTLDDGTQIRYLRRIDQVLIHENAIPDVGFMAEVHGAFLGVIGPRRLEDVPNDVNVAVFGDKLDGREVVVYEIRDPDTGDACRIWADPSVGYRYRKVEFVRNGKVVQRIVAKDYKFFDGIPFPTFHEDTIYRDDPNHPVSKRKTIQVFEARFNQELDPNAFKVRFTPDTYLMSSGRRFKPCPDKDCELSVEELLEKAN